MDGLSALLPGLGGSNDHKKPPYWSKAPKPEYVLRNIGMW